jgi:hypothetical protein
MPDKNYCTTILLGGSRTGKTYPRDEFVLSPLTEEDKKRTADFNLRFQQALNKMERELCQ